MAKPNSYELLIQLHTKFDILSRQVEDHMKDDKAMWNEIQESLDGCDEYPGVRGRLDRLEQRLSNADLEQMKTFKTQVKAIGSAFGVMLGFLGWEYVRNFFVVQVIGAK